MSLSKLADSLKALNDLGYKNYDLLNLILKKVN
jgi:hypothetical protein